MPITPQQARQELARRELARRSMGEDEVSNSPGFIDQVKQAFIDTGKSIVDLPYKLSAHALQGLEGQFRPDHKMSTYKNPITGTVVEPYTIETPLGKPIGLGLQGAALVTGNPTLGGAMIGGGGAIETGENIGNIAKSTALGALGGKVLGVMSGEPILSGKSSEIVKSGVKNITKLPISVGRSINKYKVLRKGSQFKNIRQDLTPLERVKNLEQQAKEKYNAPLKQEEELLKQQLGKISEKEKVVIEKTKQDIAQNKQKFNQDVDNLTSKMKEETTHLRDNIELASQQSAVKGKQRFIQFTKENSTSYGNKLDDILSIAEKENKLPTRQALEDIFAKTDAEIENTFIDTGAPLSKYNALKEKYIGGFNAEVNPEMQALSKVMGFKKGQMKNAGINWDRVDVAQSGFKPPDLNKPVNLKELLQDIRSVKKSISAKGQGPERAFTDEDLVSIIFEKNVGDYMASTYPEFAKLQKSYSPLMEQMKAGRKIFKPGTPYDLGTAPKVLVKPDIAEKKLISELEQGTKGFNKGIGPVSQPVIKAQNKLAGTEKGYQIAKERINKLNEAEQRDLGELLKIREEAYKLAKEKVTVKSMIRQKQIKDMLDKRLQDLEKGQFKGEIGVSKKIARRKITAREKKIATGGGLATMIDYLIRRTVAKNVLP